MKRDEITRRKFLVKLSAATGLTVGAGTILSACGGGDSGQTPAETPAADVPAVSVTCDDVSGLSEQEVQLRTSLQYVDNSPDPTKLCSNCALYVPTEGDNPCGACTLLKGPIAPAGWCSSWAPKPA